MGKISSYPVVTSMNPGDYFLIDSTPITENSTSIITKSNVLGTTFVNPLTTLGDTLYENATPAAARLAGNSTTTKNFLTQTGTGSVSAAPSWGTISVSDVPTLNQSTTGNAATATTSSGLTSASTTVTISASLAPVSGQVLTATNSTQAAWENSPAGFTNPMTTSGDLIRGGASGAAARLGIGTTGQVLTVSGGLPIWATAAASTATFFNAKAYGATGNGSTDDTTAIKAAITAALATQNQSATVYFPAGTYVINSTLSCGTAGGNGVLLRGDGHQASRISKGSSGFFAVNWNGNGGPSGNPTAFGGMVDISIEGNGTTGGAVQTNSAEQMFFRGCSYTGHNDVVFDLNTMQDSYWLQCTFNTNHASTLPVIHIYGSSSGNTNMLWFEQIRIEDFYNQAIKIELGSGGSGTNIGFFFDQIKLETGDVSGDFFYADTNTLQLYMNSVFMSANSYKAGYSTPVNGINSGAYQSAAYRDIYFNDGIGGQLSAVNINAAQYGQIALDNIFFNGNAANGTVYFESFQGATFSIGQIGTDGSGPNYAGDSSGFQTVMAPTTFTKPLTTAALIYGNNAVTVASNAGTCPVAYALNTFTNSSSATMAITMATSGAVDGQIMVVRVYDHAATSETIGWTNTENGGASVPTTSNGSTTLPKTVTFMFNGSTSKWRCISSA